nr:putative reverse transcriptase domain-containing protein [Tanacetum cinerariifolium]
LKLRDEDGIISIQDTELFENLTLMGYNISQNQKGEGSGTPTEPHHTPSPEADTSHPTTSSIPLPYIPTAPIPPVTQSDTTPIKQYSRRTRIAYSSALLTVTDKPASPMRDVSEGEACPTESGFIADQDRQPLLSPPPCLMIQHQGLLPLLLMRAVEGKGESLGNFPLDQIRTDLSYAEEPEAIIDRQDRIMRKKTIPFVKILWRNHPEREATWETEESQLSHVHDVFHVSLLRGYKYQPLHAVTNPLNQIRTDLSYAEEPEAILERQDRIMSKKTMADAKSP